MSSKKEKGRSVQDYSAFSRILENHYISNEILDHLLGKFLGEGASRIVFEYKPDPKWVIKIEKNDWHCNVLENDIYQAVRYTKWEKWFAPVKGLSAHGTLLLQRKCEKLYEKPKKLPSFMGDIDMGNMGMLNGQLVVIDYAYAKCVELGLKHGKMISTKGIL